MVLRFVSLATVALLSVPSFGSTIFSPNDPSLHGTVVASQTVPILSFLPSADTALLVDEKVVETTTGTLDFYYEVLPPPNIATTLKDFGIQFLSSDLLQVNFGYLDEGNLAPSSSNIMTIGGTSGINYHFGPNDELVGLPLPDAGTDWLTLRTNTTAYTTGSLSADRSQDDQISPAVALVPDVSSVPEPTGLALLSAGITGLAIKWRF